MKMVLPTAPGTAPDIIARIIGNKLAATMGQPVIVENKPGAGGILAMNQLRHAPADGYTFSLVHAAVATVTPLTYKEAKYDIERDYETVAVLGVTPMLFVAGPKFEAKTLADAIKAAKAAPDQVSIGNPQRTSIPHLANELLAMKTGARFQQVPFATTGQGVQAVISGDISMYTDGVGPLLQLVKSGRLHALAIAADKVLPGLEGIPLAQDAVPGLNVYGWFMVAAPKGTPKPVVERLNAELNAALQMPDVIAKFGEFGTYATPGSVAAAQAFVKREKTLFGGVVKSIGAIPE
ncbi:tripartite tricarboxylate transporter substrate-binding protein [Variovorax robiniae]|uniref:Tripartite tricarboxylate transporter substrate-binding protein n=1 Tax=Variovorax robiniae TaxID=1836199 RepID=A0ABU8XJ58_9BURK